MKITELIEMLKDNIKDFYFHRNYDSGNLELNIKFIDYEKTNDVLDKVKDEVAESNSSASWE